MMERTLAQVELELQRSRNAMDASTFNGRSRTETLQAEANRLRAEAAARIIDTKPFYSAFDSMDNAPKDGTVIELEMVTMTVERARFKWNGEAWQWCAGPLDEPYQDEAHYKRWRPVDDAS
jgi:hypothetical protein